MAILEIATAAAPVEPRVLRVLVADGHAATRAGIRAALEGAGFVVVAACADAASAIAAADRHRPSISLVDVDLPGGGVSTARAIAARPGAPIREPIVAGPLR